MLDVGSVLARQEDAMVEFAPPSTHLSERIGNSRVDEVGNDLPKLMAYLQTLRPQ